jgi:hypothetical protein
LPAARRRSYGQPRCAGLSGATSTPLAPKFDWTSRALGARTAGPSSPRHGQAGRRRAGPALRATRATHAHGARDSRCGPATSTSTGSVRSLSLRGRVTGCWSRFCQPGNRSPKGILSAEVFVTVVDNDCDCLLKPSNSGLSSQAQEAQADAAPAEPPTCLGAAGPLPAVVTRSLTTFVGSSGW